MKKLFRAVLCGAVLALTLCTGAMAAAPTDLSIEYNSQPLTFTDAYPHISNSRTYLPFRTVFTALGFADDKITFDNDTRKVLAVRDDLEVSMIIGENKVTVVKDGKTSVLDTDVPAYIDPAVSRTFVPASFVAQAAGYRVGWNGETRTVYIDDVDAILAGNKETYKLLDQYLAYSRKLRDNNYTVAGTFTSEQDGVAMKGTYSMLAAGNTKFDYEMEMKLSGQSEGQDLTAALPEGISLAMRGNVSSGEYYFKSDMLNTMMGIDQGNIWFKMDMKDAVAPMGNLPGMPYVTMMDMDGAVTDNMDGKTMVYNMAQLDSTMSVVDQLAMYNAILSDSAFEKKGSDRVSYIEAENLELTLTFHTSGSRVNGYTVIMSAAEDGVETKSEVSMQGKKMLSTYQVKSDGSSVIMKMDGTCTVSGKSPKGAPDKNDLVVDLSKLGPVVQ